MRLSLLTLPAAVLVALGAPAAATQQPSTPSRDTISRTPPRFVGGDPHGQSLRITVAELKRDPIVLDPNATDAKSIDRFIARAAVAVPAEQDTVRSVLSKAQYYPRFADALADRALYLRDRDHSGCLVALALLGTLRNAKSELRLAEFVALPLPTKGQVVDGEIVERTALEELQMKAVQGIAYARTPTSFATVLKLAAGHPSQNVRAEAIDAYLYNNAYSPAARKSLEEVVRPADRVFLDRPHVSPGISADAIDAQVRRYLALHPDLRPDSPAKAPIDYTMLKHDQLKDATATARPSKPVDPPDRLR